MNSTSEHSSDEGKDVSRVTSLERGLEPSSKSDDTNTEKPPQYDASPETGNAGTPPATALTTSQMSESQVSIDSALSKVTTLASVNPSEDPILKCLLLADTTTEYGPVYLHQLLQHFDEDVLTPAELLLLLIYCVALESGFVTQEEYAKCSDVIERLSPISPFHSKNLLEVTRLRPTYKTLNRRSHLSLQLHNLVKTPQKAKPPLLNALLTCLVTGDFLIVNFMPARSRSIPGSSLCLSIARYVLSAQSNRKPLHQNFRKLDELSSLLRQHMFLPVRNAQMNALEINIYPSLVGLPTELYEAIFQHLNKNQMKTVANVCKLLNYFSTTSKYFVK